MQVGEVADANQDLRDLISAAREAARTPVLSYSLEQIGERVCLAQELRAVCDAVVVGAAMAADDQLIGPNNKARTTAQFVAANTNVDGGGVRRDVALGEWLRDFPEFQDAFNAGILTRTHIWKLRGADNPRTHSLLVRDQWFLVDAGRDCAYRDFGHVVTQWLNRNDDDGALPREQLAKTGLTYRKNSDGSVQGNFYFDALSGSAVFDALETEVQKLRHKDKKTDTRRSQRQLRAAALISLLAKGSRRKDGTFPAALINIVMSQRVAEEIIARLHQPSNEPWPISLNDPDERCELLDGTPLHPEFALAAMAKGRFRRIIFDAEERIDKVSKSRAFPQWIKDMALIESRGKCQTPGCDAPFHWLHADHVVPYSKGGLTSITNCETRCEPDNLFKSDRENVFEKRQHEHEDDEEEGEEEAAA